MNTAPQRPHKHITTRVSALLTSEDTHIPHTDQENRDISLWEGRRVGYNAGFHNRRRKASGITSPSPPQKSRKGKGEKRKSISLPCVVPCTHPESSPWDQGPPPVLPPLPLPPPATAFSLCRHKRDDKLIIDTPTPTPMMTCAQIAPPPLAQTQLTQTQPSVSLVKELAKTKTRYYSYRSMQQTHLN